MEDNPVVRIKAPVTESIILLIALITTLVYGTQRARPSGVVAWYNSPLMLFVSLVSLVLGSLLAYTSSRRPGPFTQYMSGAIALAMLYPIVIGSVSIARQDSSKDGGVYSSVETVLVTLASILIAANLFVVVGVGLGNVSPSFAATLVTYTLPIAISVLLFSSAILVTK